VLPKQCSLNSCKLHPCRPWHTNLLNLSCSRKLRVVAHCGFYLSVCLSLSVSLSLCISGAGDGTWGQASVRGISQSFQTPSGDSANTPRSNVTGLLIWIFGFLLELGLVNLHYFASSLTPSRVGFWFCLSVFYSSLSVVLSRRRLAH
jgi:hypothetical protein